MPIQRSRRMWAPSRKSTELSVLVIPCAGPRAAQLPPAGASMNQQGVSEICFDEGYRVPADQTARSLFARLPHGCAYAETLIECLATGYLVAVAESICIREMQRNIDPSMEVVVGRTVRV